MTEPPRITGIQRILRHSQLFCVRIKPVTVGSDFVDRHYVAHVLTVEIPAIAVVAICAVLRVEFLALWAELRLDRKRIFGRFLAQAPLLAAGHLLHVARRWTCPRAERS